MNLLRAGRALEQVIATGPALHLDADRCVRHWHREHACRLCVDGCPVQALTVTAAGVALDAETCVECGYCLHACPTGALAGRDETAKLWQAAALPSGAVIDLTCGHFPAVQAEPDVTAIVEVGGCLAALGAAAYVGLGALGVAEAGVRVEACGDCPIGALYGAIADSVAAARVLTAMLVALKGPPAAGCDKPRRLTRAPRVTRRSLWGRLAGDQPAPAPPLLAPEEPAADEPAADESPAADKLLPPERRALLRALAHSPDAQRTQAPFFPNFTAAPACTACGVCAAVCPTGALALRLEDGAFQLEFAPLACTGCGLCTQFCAPQALQPAPPVAYGEAHPAVLLAGASKPCRRCRAPFAGEGELCPVCAYRRRHPAGSVMRSLPAAH